ncbi:hypothetical protein [Paraburkholderia aromaticivorans]|uniref:hypothetical protein n=1 Tax=Paraburkholderia aromaticivorans TaxID=2026199 RepID=UPI001455F774|nr:hypothetical protein [Paraburkholderia aromaticivorans]
MVKHRQDANSKKKRTACSTQAQARQWPACEISIQVRSVSNVIQRVRHASMMMREAETLHRVGALLTLGKTE